MNSRKVADPAEDARLLPGDRRCLRAWCWRRSGNAKKLTTNKKRVWLKGVGHCTDAFRLGDRDLADTRALKEAAKKRLRHGRHRRSPQATSTWPRSTTPSPTWSRMWLEGLGFCDDGMGCEYVERGYFDFNGKLPVNPSGGRLSANPVQVAGLCGHGRVRAAAAGRGRQSARSRAPRPPWCTASTACAASPTASGYWVSREVT